MQNIFWDVYMKSVRNYMEVIEGILRYVKKNLKIERYESFFTPMPTSIAPTSK